MEGHAEQAFFVHAVGVRDAVRDVEEHLAGLHALVIVEDIDHALLAGDEDPVRAISRMSQHDRTEGDVLALIGFRLPVGPLQGGERLLDSHGQSVFYHFRGQTVRTQRTQLDIAIGHQVAVILQTDVAFLGLAESGSLGELALGNAFIPVGAADLELLVDDAVHLNFALLIRDADVELVPLTGWAGRVGNFLGEIIGLRLIEAIQPTRQLGIMRLDVVLNLDFRTGFPGGAVLFGHAEHDAGVAFRGDLVLDEQLKIVVLIGSDDIASALVSAGQCTIDDFPAVADLVLLKVPPASGRLSIEQRNPSRLSFGGSDRIVSPDRQHGRQQ